MMIFVTIGGQEPFDRLIEAMDLLAPKLNGYDIVAQVLNSNYKAKNIKTISYLSPKEFDFYFDEATLIVGHAGMGTILTALQREKPIIVIPRKIELKEHRNNHQWATAQKMTELNYVHVVNDEKDLLENIRKFLETGAKSLFKINSEASDSLLESIKDYTEEIASI
ncbi:glycosyltransferase [Pedobacter agri]|uniref:glycosyltransferase n=1 Tax=Pedobacter agri TaxID=454586 RepID=UPI002931A6C0|nr:glycosyltransferase [Pedobacter agri]